MLPSPVHVERSRDTASGHKHLDSARCERFGLTILPDTLHTMLSRPQVIPNVFLARRREVTKNIDQEAIALRLRGFARIHNALEYKRFAAS